MQTLRYIVVRLFCLPTGPAENRIPFRGDLPSSGAATASAFDPILCLARRLGGGVGSIEPCDTAAVNVSVEADCNSLGVLPLWTVKIDLC
jgi:hypothetical protein